MAAVTTKAEATRDDTAWHNLPAEDVAARLGVDPRSGLDPAEVEKRRAEHGLNKLAEGEKEPAWKAFLRQYRDLMQIVLLGAAVVSIVAAAGPSRIAPTGTLPAPRNMNRAQQAAAPWITRSPVTLK